MRASRIVSGWAEQKAVREIMIFLHAHGVGTARAVRIFKTYGYEAIQVMTEDPYRLAKDVRGIGFRTADAIAAKLGMEKTAPQRIRAGISFALQTATDEGHCALPVEALTRLAEQLLEVDQDLIRTAIVEELVQGRGGLGHHRRRDLPVPQGALLVRAGHRLPADRAGLRPAAVARHRP